MSIRCLLAGSHQADLLLFTNENTLGGIKEAQSHLTKLTNERPEVWTLFPVSLTQTVQRHRSFDQRF